MTATPPLLSAVEIEGLMEGDLPYWLRERLTQSMLSHPKGRGELVAVTTLLGEVNKEAPKEFG